MKLSEAETREIHALADDLRRLFNASAVRLYGSAVRDALQPDSDIDLFIEVPALTWALEQRICDRCYETTLAIGRHVAPAVFSVEELHETPLRSSPFVRRVASEGVAV